MRYLDGAAWASAFAAAWLLLGPIAPAAAHGFGRRFSLPVPLWLYATGAAAAVALSFVVVALFVRRAPGVRPYPRVNLFRFRWGRLLAHPLVVVCLRLTSVGALVLLVLAGLLGNQHPMKNLAPTLVWIVWWIGLAYVSALAGNLWALINPWAVCFRWAEGLYRRVSRGRELARREPYPRRLGVWPGVLLFLGFAWVELVSEAAAVPSSLASMALGYSLITWIGMFVFGREQWLAHGEAFTLAFGVLARFAPTEVRGPGGEECRDCELDCRDRDGECIDCYACFERAHPAHREWNLRPFAAGLVRNETVSVSKMVFVILLLATVTFDGFMATPLWASIEDSLYAALPELGGLRLRLVGTLGLVAAPALFVSVYLAFGRAMAGLAGGRLSGTMLARALVFSLVPIAIAYHLAHYLTFLLIQGQLIVPLVSDPLGFGWDLLGTARYRVDIGMVGARFEWFTAVTTIVVGHMIAVYLAHLIALRALGDQSAARRSQYPMLVLMVGYTTVSLWILAQPIVRGGG